MTNHDPDCRYCRGTGVLTLFSSSCKCECIKPETPYELIDYKPLPLIKKKELYLEFITTIDWEVVKNGSFEKGYK